MEVMKWRRSFLVAAAALKTPTRNGYNAQGANLTFPKSTTINAGGGLAFTRYTFT